MSGSFPNRFTRIDELTLPDHSFLTSEDQCYFIGEYTARAGFSYSATNQLIHNFKKPMEKKDTPQWKWKINAIKDAALAMQGALGATVAGVTFVPVPPSKAKSDPLHDDRMMQMLRAINQSNIDIRELVIQSVTTEAAHALEVRLKPHELQALYQIQDNLCAPAPSVIAVCDDVLSAGCHYRAMSAVLKQRFPDTKIVGLFLARRVSLSDFDDFEDLTAP